MRRERCTAASCVDFFDQVELLSSARELFMSTLPRNLPALRCCTLIFRPLLCFDLGTTDTHILAGRMLARDLPKKRRPTEVSALITGSAGAIGGTIQV